MLAPRSVRGVRRPRHRRRRARRGGRRAELHRPRRAGGQGALDAGRQAGLRHGDDDAEQGLAHAAGRRADRGLLPGPQHAGAARPAAHRHRRQDVHRPRDRRHRPARRARRQAQPDVPPDQHGEVGALPDRQDLRHRSGPQHAAGRRALPVAHRAPVPGLRLRRPVAQQRRQRRLGQHVARRAADPGRHGGERPRRRAVLRPHLHRLPGRQRRLGRPARRPPDGLAVPLLAERQRRPDRADQARRPPPPAPAARAGLRHHERRGARHRARVPAARLRPRRRRVRRQLASLPGLAQAPAGQREALRRRVRRVGHGPGRPRGQDLPRRLHRLAHDAVGVGNRVRVPQVGRLPRRVVARPLPDRHRDDGGRRSRRRRARAELRVRQAAAPRRLHPPEHLRRRHAALGRHAAGRGRLPDRPRLAAAPRRRADLRPARQAGGRLARPDRAPERHGPLGEPVRLVAGHDRLGDRRADLRRRPRAPERRRRERGHLRGRPPTRGRRASRAGRRPPTARTPTSPTTCA